MITRAARDRKVNLCVRVHKVYDWVLRDIEVPLMQFNRNIGNLPAFSCSDYVWDPCELESVETMLSDEGGQPLDPSDPRSFQCEEISQPEGRKRVRILGPHGDLLTLEKVWVRVKGFIVIALMDSDGNECTSKPIPWTVKEKFYLCAPDGTEVNCEVTYFDSDVILYCKDSMEPPPMPSKFSLGSDMNHFVSPMLDSIDLSISLCLEVTTESSVSLKIDAVPCRPREESSSTCPLPKKLPNGPWYK